jgi:exopolysaccharide production protein ExoQ
MPPALVAVIFIVMILALIVLDRDSESQTSRSLWIPTAWLLIVGSRPVSTWLGMAPKGSPQQYLEGSPLDRNVYMFLLAAGILVLVGRRAVVATILRRNWLLLFFILYCGISVSWSDFPGVAIKRWVKSLGDYVIVLILLTERDWVVAVKKVLARAGIVLLPLSVLFIKYFPDLGRSYALKWEGTQFFVGVSSDKNMLGMSCMVCGFAAVWRILEAWSDSLQFRTRTYIIHGSILAMAIWLLDISNSMTSLACFVLTSTFIAAHTFSKAARNRRIMHLSVMAIVLGCASVLYFNAGGGLLESMGRNPTLTGRTEIWEILLNVPINPMVGTGFESFWLGERLEHLWTFPIVHGVNEAHNGYLEVFLNLGWIGMAFLAVLLWTGYKNVLSLIERDSEAGRLRLGYFVIAVIYNFTEAAVRSTSLVWIAFLLATIAVPQGLIAQVPAAKAHSVRSRLAKAEPAV